ncbi:MAG: PAS domain S-box protein [Actinomycetota bacterium]|nr:PAS domain S-box protein [Actinomycetota bacterium]
MARPETAQRHRRAPLPRNELERLDALRRYGILDDNDDPVLADITRAASLVCETPIALVSFIDANRQWFGCALGLDVRESDRETAFCAHAILSPDAVMVVPDATADERFASNPVVIGEPNVGFYAGAPLVTLEGHALGTLCVIDHQARTLRPDQIETLRLLARTVVSHLESRRELSEAGERVGRLDKTVATLRQHVDELLPLFESFPTGLLQVTGEGIILRTNETLSRMTGQATEALRKKPITALLAPEDGVLEEHWRAALVTRGGAQRHQIFRLRTAEGRLRAARVAGHQVLDEQGELRCLLYMATDITERSNAERELQETQSALDGVVSADADGHIISWDRGAARMFGYAESEAIGQPLRLIIPQRYYAAHRRGLARVNAGGPSKLLGGEPVELYALRRDGTEFPIELSLTRWGPPDAPCYTSVIRDTTERRNAELALREQQRTWATLLSNLPGMAYRCGADDGRPMEFVSEGSRVLTGYAPEELTGEGGARYAALVHHEDRAGVDKQIRQALGADSRFEVTYRLTTKDGDQRWVWEQGRGIRDDAAELVGIEGFIADITTMKQAETRLAHRALHDSLTGLPNRANLHAQLSKKLDGGEPLAVLFVDLDRFKLVNDSFGHSVGDDLLVKLGERLQDAVRPGDLVARLGADEFAILCEGLGRGEEALAIAGGIRSAVRRPLAVGAQHVLLRASIGVALGATHDQAETLLRDAGVARDVAKDHGGDRAVVYEDRMLPGRVNKGAPTTEIGPAPNPSASAEARTSDRTAKQQP